MRHLTLILSALLAAAPLATLHAAPANVAAAVSARSRPAEARELDAGRKPAQVLRFLGLRRGDRALDLFTGSGYYAEIMARAVGPRGSVLAWQPANFHDDESKKNWEALRRRAPNARLLVTGQAEMLFAPASFDLVMLHLNFHDLYLDMSQAGVAAPDPSAFLASIHAALKPGGVVGVVDHVAAAGGDVRQVAASVHRIDPAVIRADFERAGFLFDGESDLLRMPSDDHSRIVFDPSIRGKTDRVLMRFRKPRG